MGQGPAVGHGKAFNNRAACGQHAVGVPQNGEPDRDIDRFAKMIQEPLPGLCDRHGGYRGEAKKPGVLGQGGAGA